MVSETVNQNIEEVQTEPGSINPTKFVLWLMIVASLMLFASFTSAYIVRRGEGNWLIFDLPQMFGFSTAVIMLSSVTMQLAFSSFKKNNVKNLRTLLYSTLFLGITFAVFQVLGWKQLVANNIHFVGNPSESFFYVISGLHLLHVIGGLGFVLFVLIQSSKGMAQNKKLSINLCTTYWHFLGILWVYLYVFLLLNR